MKPTVLIASLAVLVMLAAPSTSHEFTPGATPSDPGNHTCSGTPDWKERPGVSSFGLTLLDQPARVYVHLPPHGDPDNQDPAPFLGLVWIESNGLEGFQKNDFVCTPTDSDGEASPHPDLVVL